MTKTVLICGIAGLCYLSSEMWKRFEDAKDMDGGLDRALEVLLAHACAVSFDEGLTVDGVLYLMFTNAPR